jgi:multiple sugar transport system ATP-binding protein
MAGVVLENVSRVYPGGVAAVRELNLGVRDREFLVLVGPSGCGKTTALRLIAGLEKLSSGSIRIGMRFVNNVPPKDRDVAMVFQNYALYPHLSVAENLAFGLKLREGPNGWGRADGWGWLWQWALPARRRAAWTQRRAAIDQRVRQAATTLGIEDLLDRFPGQLSGGEKQRVAVGRAIVRQPAVFLFDEPLSNLDAKLRVEMRRELKQLQQRLAATVVLVTHDQVEALSLGQRVAVMHEGRIQQVGTPREVYDWPVNRFVADFIGTPAMNFIEGELTSEGSRKVFRRGNWLVPLDARTLAGTARLGPAVLGVRGEDVRIGEASTARAAMPAVVQSVELLGDSTDVTLEITTTSWDSEITHAAHKNGACYVLTRIGPHCTAESGGRVQPGDCVAVAVDPARVHVFDPHSGENWVRSAETCEAADA